MVVGVLYRNSASAKFYLLYKKSFNPQLHLVETLNKNSHFFRSFFNIQTFSGFYATLLVHFISILAYFAIYALMPILQIGFCTYMKACAADFKSMMKDVADYIEKNYGENDIRANDPHIRICFKDAVELHVEMLR